MEFRPACAEEIPQIRTVLATALADDPLVRWHFPPAGPVVAAEPHGSMAEPRQATAELVEADQQRLSRVASYFMLAVERLVLQGRSFAVVDEGRILGAALWMPPGMEREPSLPRPRDFMTQLLGETVLMTSAQQFEKARQEAPGCDGFYLAELGVLPGRQGSGLGSGLMRYCMGELESPLWAESANPRNLDFYRRLGFDVVHQAPLFDTTLSRLCLER